jgi:hypothetical protein
VLTQDRLKELLDYDSNTGIFTQKSSRDMIRSPGSINTDGYLLIRVDNHSYSAHRLAWLFMTGKFPDGALDHINGNRADNRIDNLREVTNRQNAQNRSCHREGHLPGTTFIAKSQKWKSQIRINGKRKHLGYYDSQEEAHKVYLKALSLL